MMTSSVTSEERKLIAELGGDTEALAVIAAVVGLLTERSKKTVQKKK